MKEITRDDVENCNSKYDEFLKNKMDLYRVFVQPEYLEYFSNTDNVFYTGMGEDGGYHGLAAIFKDNIIRLQRSCVGNSFLYRKLVSMYHRTENSITVAYELIPDEAIAKLSADEIVSIYMGEMVHERWGGAFAGLFEHPFFIKSLYRLRDLLDEFDSAKIHHSFRI